jgi:hypothetical protein
MEPGARHTGVYGLNPARYIDRLDAFFSSAMDA